MKAIAILVVVMVMGMVTAVGGPVSSAEPDAAQWTAPLPLRAGGDAASMPEEPTSARCSGFAPLEVLCDETFTVPADNVIVGMRLVPGRQTIRVIGLRSGTAMRWECTTAVAAGICIISLGNELQPGDEARLVGDVHDQNGVAVVGVGSWAVCVGTAQQCTP